MNILAKPTYVAYTKAGVPIVIMEGAQNQKRERGEDYRRCQIQPPLPQRFEWINIKNITARRVDS